MAEYIDQNIQHLTWQIAAKSSDIAAPEVCGDNIISGSKTKVSIWQFTDSSEVQDQLPITEAASEKIPVAACKVNLIGSIAFAALTNGTVLLYELVTESNNRKFLNQLSKAQNLHPGYRCNDMLFCAQTNSVITCGNDGRISSFNIENPRKVQQGQASMTSLKCMDMISPNEVICGTLNGSLIHIDLRTYTCISTFASQSLSSLLCVHRNPNVNHSAIGGDDQGSIMVYDLRNQSSVFSLSAHSAAVTTVKYRPRDPNVLYSSSCSGELFRWNLNSDFSANQMPKRVESIGCVGDALAINSFDINHLGDLIYTTDHGAIYYRKVQEIGP